MYLTGTPLDITEDPDNKGDWYYPDGTEVIDETYRPFGDAPVGHEDQTCAKWKYVNEDVNIVERITCTNRNAFMCQFC